MSYTPPGRILAKQKFKNKKKPYSRNQVNKAASDLGKMGASKGGHARADALSITQRRSIAQHSANVRWGNRCSPGCEYC